MNQKEQFVVTVDPISLSELSSWLIAVRNDVGEGRCADLVASLKVGARISRVPMEGPCCPIHCSSMLLLERPLGSHGATSTFALLGAGFVLVGRLWLVGMGFCTTAPGYGIGGSRVFDAGSKMA